MKISTPRERAQATEPENAPHKTRPAAASGATSLVPAPAGYRPAGPALPGSSAEKAASAARQRSESPLPSTAGGKRLPDRLIQDVSAHAGAGASLMRVHDGPQGDVVAKTHRARAVAHGRDVYFARGAYAPGTSAGNELIAHEAEHVRQHVDGDLAGASTTARTGVLSRPGEPAEREAEKTAGALRRGSITRQSPMLEAETEPGAQPQPRRLMRYTEDDEGNIFYDVDVPLDFIEQGADTSLELTFLVPLSRSVAVDVESIPGHAEAFQDQLRAILNPGGEPTRETPEFLLGPGFAAVLARDLQRSSDSGLLALTSTDELIRGRKALYEQVRIVGDLEAWLYWNAGIATPIDWNTALLTVSHEDPFEPVTASDHSFLARYHLFIDMLRVELHGHETPPGAVVPAMEDLRLGILSYLGGDEAPDWGEATSWRSEVFLDEWMERLEAIEYVPEGFDIADHEPLLDEAAIERERERVLDDWLAPVPSGTTTFGGNSRAADLLAQYVLDAWMQSRDTPDEFLASLDLDSFRADAIDWVAKEFAAYAAGDKDLQAAVRDYAVERARWDMLRGMYLGAVAWEGNNRDMADRMRTVELSELDELEEWVAADPYVYVITQEGVGAATHGFFERIDRGTSLEEATVWFVEAMWQAFPDLAGENPHLALLIEFALAADHLRDTFREQVSAAEERIRDALDARYDDIAEIVRNYAEYAQRFIDTQWVPTLKAVAIERLTANRDDLQEWLDTWDTRTPQLIARYDLAAGVLEQAAEDLRSGTAESIELDGHVVTVRDAGDLETAAAVMRANAAALRDPDRASERRDEIKEAVAGFDDVIQGVMDEDPYKPWNLGTEIKEEAQRRLGLAGFGMPVTYGMVLSRTFVAHENPFLMYAIARWEYVETLDEQLNTIVLFAGLGALSVAALAAPGVAGALLTLVDLGAGLTMAVGHVSDAYALRRMARLDVDLSVYGVTEEQAEKAISNAWVGFFITAVFAVVGGTLAGITLTRAGSRLLRKFRFPNVVALETAEPALLSQLLQMTRNVRQLEELLAVAGDAGLLRQLLLHGSGDDIAHLLTLATDARSLLGVLGHADSVAHAQTLLGLATDTGGLVRVLDTLGDAARVQGLASRTDPARLIAAVDALPLAPQLSDDAIVALSRLDLDVMPHLTIADDVVLDNIAAFARTDAAAMSRLLRTHEDAAIALRMAQSAQADDLVKPVKEAVMTRITGDAKFAFTHTDEELRAIIAKGKAVGLSQKEIEHLVFASCRKDKPLSAMELMEQMDFHKYLKSRGFPAKFKNMNDFDEFKVFLDEQFSAIGVDTRDLRIQGSAVRSPTAGDIDAAAMVSQAEFDGLIKRIYGTKIVEGGKALDITNYSHEELVELAQRIEANPTSFNGAARSDFHFNFTNKVLQPIPKKRAVYQAMDLGKMLKALQERFPHLNIDNFTIQVRGGKYDSYPFWQL